MSGLLLGMALSVCICWFHSMVTLPPRLVSTDFGTCSYYYYYYYYYFKFCHRHFLPGTASEPKAIPAQDSSLRLQHILHCVCCSKYSCLLQWICWMFSWYGFTNFLWAFVSTPVPPTITATITHLMFHILRISIHILLYFSFLSVSFCTFLSEGIAASISVFYPFWFQLLYLAYLP
jgi:hypothetical protein